MRKFFVKTDSKKFCQICGRNGHEDESCAALPVTFTWKYGGNEVFLCGSFNQWQVKRPLQKSDKGDVFKIEMCLAPAKYQYKFIVDGEWQLDPEAETIDDGKSGFNNQVEVTPANFSDEEETDQEDYLVFIANKKDPKSQYKVKKICYDLPAIWVTIKGSWDDWHEQIALKRSKNNFTGFYEFYVTMKLAPGTYEFKFMVDSRWTTNLAYPTVTNKQGYLNNVLSVPAYSTLACPKPTNLEEKICLNWRREDSKWTECPTIHHTLQGHSLSVICDIVYVFGGMANGKFTNTMYAYDPKTNEFSLIEDQGGDVPDPRAFHNATVFGTKILIYGGFNKEYLTDYYSFNTINNTWIQADIDGDGPCPRERASLVPYIEDKLVLFGGYYCSPDMEVEKYFSDTYVLNLSLMEWIQPTIEGETPQARSAHTANFVKGKMYVFGGITQQRRNLNDIWVLKATATGPLHWRKIEAKGTPPEARHGHSAAVADTNIIFFGGRGADSKKLFDDLILFDCVNELWIHPKVGGIRPTPRYFHASATLNGGAEIVIFGGIRPREFLNYPRMYVLETNSKEQFDEIKEQNDEEDKAIRAD